MAIWRIGQYLSCEFVSNALQHRLIGLIQNLLPRCKTLKITPPIHEHLRLPDLAQIPQTSKDPSQPESDAPRPGLSGFFPLAPGAIRHWQLIVYRYGNVCKAIERSPHVLVSSAGTTEDPAGSHVLGSIPYEGVFIIEVVAEETQSELHLSDQRCVSGRKVCHEGIERVRID